MLLVLWMTKSSMLISNQDQAFETHYGRYFLLLIWPFVPAVFFPRSPCALSTT